MDDNRPVRLSVFCLTYNHAKYIRQALDGFVGQKTDFRYEILIHDDASTDGTAEIVKDYVARYPGLFVPFYEVKNQYTRGGSYLVRYFSPAARGEYVALCEGDDYWTDALKLQRQVDWLDAHPKSNVCFHPVRVHYEGCDIPDSVFPSSNHAPSEFTFSRLLDWNFIQTNSVVYRWQLKGREQDMPVGIKPGDWYFHLLHAEGGGEIGFIPQVMSVYRRHRGGVWWSEGNQDAFHLRNGLPHLAFYKAVKDRFGYENPKHVSEMAVNTLLAAMRSADSGVLADLATRFPSACGYAADSLSSLMSSRKALRRRNRRLMWLLALSALVSVALLVALVVVLCR